MAMRDAHCLLWVALAAISLSQCTGQCTCAVNDKVEIHITASPRLSDASISASGSLPHATTQADREAYQIAGDDLAAAMDEAYGQRPVNTWIRLGDPHQLFESRGWDPLETVLMARGAEVMSIAEDPNTKLLGEKVLFNDLNVPTEVTVNMSVAVQYNISTRWDIPSQIDVWQEIDHLLVISSDDDSGDLDASFKTSYGESVRVLLPTNVASDTTVTLLPGQSVHEHLVANKVTLTLHVAYSSTLNGCVAAEFVPDFVGARFLCFPGLDVLLRSGLPHRIFSDELIEIEFYRARTEIVDPLSGTMLKTARAFSVTPHAQI